MFICVDFMNIRVRLTGFVYTICVNATVQVLKVYRKQNLTVFKLKIQLQALPLASLPKKNTYIRIQ